MAHQKISPGEELFVWILNRYKRQKVAQDSWVSNMSREFNMDELEDFLLRSTVLMVLRRLIWNASWYEKRFVDRSITIERFEKDYLLEVFGFGRKDRLLISKLVFESLDATKRDISPGLFTELKKQARNRNQRCEICGRIIDYDATDTQNAFSLDHLWPQSLGGLSEAWNLRTSCKNCNSRRQNIVEASDVHYEHFHVKTDQTSDPGDSFWKQLNNEFRIAALMRADFECEICGESVENMEEGPAFVTREREENFHIFNIQVYCKKHNR
jgi:hypothetical protein